MAPKIGFKKPRTTDGKVGKPRRHSWYGLGYIPRYPTFTTNTNEPDKMTSVFYVNGTRIKNETPSPDIYPLQDINGSDPSNDISRNDSEDSSKTDQDEVNRDKLITKDGHMTIDMEGLEDNPVLPRVPYNTTTNYLYASTIPRPVRNLISYRSSTSSDNSAQNSANLEKITRQLINSLTARNRRRAANKLAVTFDTKNEATQISKEVSKEVATYGTGFDPMPRVFFPPVVTRSQSDLAGWTRYQSDQLDRFILLGNDSYFWSAPPSPTLPVPLYLPIPSPDYEVRSTSLQDHNDHLENYHDNGNTIINNRHDNSNQNEVVIYNHRGNLNALNDGRHDNSNQNELVTFSGYHGNHNYHSYLNRNDRNLQLRRSPTNTSSSYDRALTGPLSVSNGVIRRTRNVRNVATGYVPQVAPSDGGMGCCGYILFIISWLVVIVTMPISLCLCLKVVQEYERAVIFRLGRLLPGGSKGPGAVSGLFFILPCMDSYTKVDLRTVSFDVPPQEILSKDSVTVAVDAVVYYRVQNATISVTNVEDAARSTRLLAATTLRNVLGTKNLSEILADRENISNFMQMNLDEATDPWGVKVERVEIKDVRLPVQLQRAMAAEAEATREARAKVIAAEGEQKASRALKDAADVMMESPSAIQLRYLQTLNTISAEKNSTIIFPLPIDLIKHFLKKDD